MVRSDQTPPLAMPAMATMDATFYRPFLAPAGRLLLPATSAFQCCPSTVAMKAGLHARARFGQ